MADDTTSSPLDTLKDAEAKISPPAPEPEPVVAPVELTAVERLRQFEDAELGEDAVRINGQIERGYGSKFKGLPAEKQRKHGALVRLIAAEQALVDAEGRLSQAQVEYAAAEAAVDGDE